MKTSSTYGIRVAALLAVLFASLSTESASAQVDRGPSRLRWGIEGGAGGAWGTPRGPALGAFGQIGVQVNDMFGFFYQPSLYVHALGTNDDSDLFVASGNLAMGDLTFGPLQLGLGGGFDVARFDECSNDVCTRGDLALHPAIGGRIALVLRLASARHRRIGIPFGLNVHTAFLDSDNRLTSLLLTIGFEHY